MCIPGGETRPRHFQTQISPFTLRESVWVHGIGTPRPPHPPRADVAEASADGADAGQVRAPALLMR